MRQSRLCIHSMYLLLANAWLVFIFVMMWRLTIRLNLTSDCRNEHDS